MLYQISINRFEGRALYWADNKTSNIDPTYNTIMKILWIIMAFVGIWFLASAATEDGLLPSGHGVGRTSEIVVGIALLGYAAFRIWRSRSRPKVQR